MKKALQYHGTQWGVLTGLLFATSYPPFPAWALFFSFVPLWVYWTNATTLRQVVVSGFVAQFTLTLIGFNWIAHTATEYGHIPRALSILVLIGFCCFASLNVLIGGAASWLIQKKFKLPALWFLLLLSVCSAFADWIYPTIFPWNTAYPLLFSGFHSAQLAEYMGFHGLSLFVYLANACFALAWMKFPQKRWSVPLVVFVLSLALFEGLGTLAAKNLGTEDAKLSILAVQPNIGNYDKFYAERGDGYQQPIVDKDLEVTSIGLKKTGVKPDVIIWPETAFPANLDPYYAGNIYAQQLRAFVEKNQIPLITGAYSEDPITERRRKSYNAVFSVVPQSMPTPGYRKHLLLAFGEYFPGAEYLPFLKNIVPEISDFGRGEGAALLAVSGLSYLPLICYEGLDTLYVSEAVKLGGEIFVNVTNDSWFGEYFEPNQHMIMTVARTVEYRRPMVRVTNTGFTVAADARGNILARGPQNQPWADVLTVPYFTRPPTTVFSVLAKYLSLIFLGLAILVVFLGVLARDALRTRLAGTP